MFPDLLLALAYMKIHNYQATYARSKIILLGITRTQVFVREYKSSSTKKASQVAVNLSDIRNLHSES